jgi:calcium/proton exchanger cax
MPVQSGGVSHDASIVTSPPDVVLLGWLIGQPMTLNFSEFEMIVLVMSVLIVNFLVKDGESNWLLGSMLVASYMILGTAFFFHPVLPGESVATIVAAPSHKSSGAED